MKQHTVLSVSVAEGCMVTAGGQPAEVVPGKAAGNRRTRQGSATPDVPPETGAPPKEVTATRQQEDKKRNTWSSQ